MSNFNTVVRAICTFAIILSLTQTAAAQSELNFIRGVQSDGAMTGIAVTNTSSYFADVQFTFYGPGGERVSGLVNPVSHRIPPKGQLAVLSTEIFGSGGAEGWIQATSSTSGLYGSSFFGDFRDTLEAARSSAPLLVQMIPFIFQDIEAETTIVLTNPGEQSASATITFYNERGEEVLSTARSLPAHAQVSLAALGASARVSSSRPILAAAQTDTGVSLLLINGQAVDRAASTRIVPHFVSGGGVQGSLVLANPTSSQVTVTVRLFSDSGGFLPPQVSRSLVVPPNGSVAVDTAWLTGLLIQPMVNGWLRIESPNVPLTGVAVLDSVASLTAVPVQSEPSERLLFSQISDAQNFSTEWMLVNGSQNNALLNVTLSRADGTTVAQRDLSISPNTKRSERIGSIMPEAAGAVGGLITIRSSVPLFGIETVRASDGRFSAAVAANDFAPFTPNAIPAGLPAIVQIEPGTDVRAGMQLRVTASNVDADTTFLFGDQLITPRPIFPGATTYLVDVPQVEPGYVNFSTRRAGLDSTVIPMRVLAPDGSLTETLQGRAFYQKAAVSDDGLDTTRTILVPIRNARVEVIDSLSGSIVSVSQTDARGRFNVLAPPQSDLIIRVLSRLRSLDLRVADNTNQNELYSIFANVDMRVRPSEVTLIDTTRSSGAFNILEMIQRGNDLISTADPRIGALPLTVYWSVRNTNRRGGVSDGLVGTTFFNVNDNIAYILGDRATDSDEFDDSVILHEYAHMLASRFSRDDSPGHAHGLGDLLDPRVAWSEGWANFFSSAARNSAVYRDSFGVNGTRVLRYDLEENVAVGDRPGYWSEHSVQSLLWDLFDEVSDNGDPAQFHFSSLWPAFTDLRNDRFVYLPYFLERFLARNPAWADILRNMVQLRAIDFQPGVRPSVTNPFPRPIVSGASVSGEVDSLTPGRSNLMQSAHFFSFTTAGGFGSVRLDIEGPGPGGNPASNDLDLLLQDANGRILQRSDRGLNGESELISAALPAGTYVIEVRSFYRQGETNSMVFNSGRYRLNLLIQ